jgi:hypothetical protein
VVAGEPDEAMSLVREAMFEGMPFDVELHRHMDLE